jgi:hypothetical protein
VLRKGAEMAARQTEVAWLPRVGACGGVLNAERGMQNLNRIRPSELRQLGRQQTTGTA